MISEYMSIKVCKTDESAKNVCQTRTLIGRIYKQWFRNALNGDKWAKAGIVYCVRFGYKISVYLGGALHPKLHAPFEQHVFNRILNAWNFNPNAL